MSSTSINTKLVTEITNLLPADPIPTTTPTPPPTRSTSARGSSSSNTNTKPSILRPTPKTAFIDPRTPPPKMYVGTYGSGFVQSPRNHLHIGSGVVTQILHCAKLVEVRPTDPQMAAGFVPAGYDHFLIRARGHLLGVGEGFWDDDYEDDSDIDEEFDEEGRKEGKQRRKKSPQPGDLAAGYWTNEHGCFQHGVGVVVKVWEHFKVRFVDPERGVDPGERLKTEFRKVRFVLPGEVKVSFALPEEDEDEEEQEEQGKEKKKARVTSRAKRMASQGANYIICWRRRA